MAEYKCSKVVNPGYGYRRVSSEIALMRPTWLNENARNSNWWTRQLHHRV